jgi:hypothetical protein
MTNSAEERPLDENSAESASGGDSTVVDRVQELTWALVDEGITDDEMRLLDNLLLSDDEARSTYVGCVQLHVDLLSHFGDPAKVPVAGKSPVLGFLGDATPPMGVQGPLSEGPNS